MTSDPDTWSRVRAGFGQVDTPMFGGMLERWSICPPWMQRMRISSELDYAAIERRFLAAWPEASRWMLEQTDEPVPGMTNTWRRVPREFVDVFEPAPRAPAQLEPSGRVTFRVSAELVQLVSPTPEPARPAGWVTFDSLAPNAGRVEVSSRRREKSTRHRDGF